MGVFHIFKIVQMVPNRATHYIQLTPENSNTQILKPFHSSNKFISPLNITRLFRQKKTLDISYISVGRTKLLDSQTISSRSLKLLLQHFGLNLKVLKFEHFIRFFGKKIHHRSFSFLVRCFLEKDVTRKTKTGKYAFG